MGAVTARTVRASGESSRRSGHQIAIGRGARTVWAVTETQLQGDERLNTAVAYAHRDLQGLLTHHRVVFTGETTDLERDTVAELFPEGAHLFFPGHAGLPQFKDCSGGSYELTDLRHVDELPTQDANVHDFVARLLRTHWELADPPMSSAAS